MSREVYDLNNDDFEGEFVREDGELWPFAMITGGHFVGADTRTELVEHLIPGYDTLPHDEEGDEQAFVARGIQACQAADLLQQLIAAVAADEGEFNHNEATEEELTAFLTPRSEHPTDILGISHWDHDVPLVLVTSFFEPYDDRVPPSGNVVWIDPTNETTYLDSLHALGQIRLFVQDGQA